MNTIGRPLEFDPDAALDAAMFQFWSTGYEHTSMQDLLVAMKLSRSSLYQAFGDKQSLFRRCIGRYTDQLTRHLLDQLSAAPTGRVFIENFLNSILDDVADGHVPQGCLVMNTASEFSQSVPEIAQEISRSIGRFRAVLKTAIVRAQREGDISPTLDPNTLANYLVSSMSGLKNQSKAGADAKTLKGIILIILKTLD